MKLTAKQARILRKMRDEDEELVFEKRNGWCGDVRVGSRLVTGLLLLMALRMDPLSVVGGVERYRINDTGKRLLAAAEGKRA